MIFFCSEAGLSRKVSFLEIQNYFFVLFTVKSGVYT